MQRKTIYLLVLAVFVISVFTLAGTLSKVSTTEENSHCLISSKSSTASSTLVAVSEPVERNCCENCNGDCCNMPDCCKDGKCAMDGECCNSCCQSSDHCPLKKMKVSSSEKDCCEEEASCCNDLACCSKKA